MLIQLRRSVVVAIFFALLCGIAYPFAETGLGQALMAHQTSGSLGPNGSVLIGQPWKGTAWFHGRPNLDAPTASGPTSLGPRSKVLEAHVAKRIAAWKAVGVNPTAELVTSSGSGLDPDINPASAYAQVDMVARARHLPVSTVHHLVTTMVHGPQLGFLGAPYVNVLQLNEALAKLR